MIKTQEKYNIEDRTVKFSGDIIDFVRNFLGLLGATGRENRL